jgi:hypothetical protein
METNTAAKRTPFSGLLSALKRRLWRWITAAAPRFLSKSIYCMCHVVQNDPCSMKTFFFFPGLPRPIRALLIAQVLCGQSSP